MPYKRNEIFENFRKNYIETAQNSTICVSRTTVCTQQLNFACKKKFMENICLRTKFVL